MNRWSELFRDAVTVMCFSLARYAPQHCAQQRSDCRKIAAKLKANNVLSSLLLLTVLLIAMSIDEHLDGYVSAQALCNKPESFGVMEFC